VKRVIGNGSARISSRRASSTHVMEAADSLVERYGLRSLASGTPGRDFLAVDRSACLLDCGLVALELLVLSRPRSLLVFAHVRWMGIEGDPWSGSFTVVELRGHRVH
jgi:hypothetical protein